MSFRKEALREIRGGLGVERFVRKKDIGCSSETWRNYERGRSTPDFNFVAELMDKCDKEYEFFLHKN